MNLISSLDDPRTSYVYFGREKNDERKRELSEDLCLFKDDALLGRNSAVRSAFAPVISVTADLRPSVLLPFTMDR